MTRGETLTEAFDDICMMDGPLNVRLAAFAAKLRELSFPFAEAYDDLVGRLYAGEIGREAPVVGDTLPSFILPSKGGSLVSLEELTEEGPVVISFNRGHWCHFCRIQLATISKFHDEISEHGARVVSIMPDRQQFTGDLRAATRNEIMILTDMDNAYALSLGLVIWVGDHLKTLMKGRGYHLDTFQGNDGWFLPLPATFVIDKTGQIIARFIDPDFRKRMNVEDIIAALKTVKT